MSSRYKIHDPHGLYFLTLTLVGWVDIFSRACYRDIVLDSLSHYQAHRGLRLHAYVFMTNHVHLIASSAAGSELGPLIQNIKKFTAKKILEAIDTEAESRRDWLKPLLKDFGSKIGQAHQVWRHENHPIELYSLWVIRQKLEYIHQNPVKAGWVVDPTAWQYSSALDYAGGKGPLQVELLDV